MESSSTVCNAGPLIALALVDKLQLLPALYQAILVPEAVWREVVDSGIGRAGAADLKNAPWIEVIPSFPVDAFIEAELGRGESQVIALGLARKAVLVLIDELASRRRPGLWPPGERQRGHTGSGEEGRNNPGSSSAAGRNEEAGILSFGAFDRACLP